jgi:hypothetical protein
VLIAVIVSASWRKSRSFREGVNKITDRPRSVALAYDIHSDPSWLVHEGGVLYLHAQRAIEVLLEGDSVPD